MSKPEKPSEDIARVTINMPKHLHEELRLNAHASGFTVTEYLRRAAGLLMTITNVALDNGLLEPDTELGLSVRKGGKEVLITSYLPFENPNSSQT